MASDKTATVIRTSAWLLIVLSLILMMLVLPYLSILFLWPVERAGKLIPDSGIPVIKGAINVMTMSHFVGFVLVCFLGPVIGVWCLTGFVVSIAANALFCIFHIKLLAFKQDPDWYKQVLLFNVQGMLIEAQYTPFVEFIKRDLKCSEGESFGKITNMVERGTQIAFLIPFVLLFCSLMLMLVILLVNNLVDKEGDSNGIS